MFIYILRLFRVIELRIYLLQPSRSANQEEQKQSDVCSLKDPKRIPKGTKYPVRYQGNMSLREVTATRPAKDTQG